MRALRVDLAQRDQAHSIFSVFHIDDGTIVFAHDSGHRKIAARGGAAELLAIGCRRILILEKPMQIGCVRRIDADLQRLKPVAAPVALERKSVAVRGDETVEFRKGRRLTLAKIRPEDAALLDHGIGTLLDAFAQLRALWLGRRFQTLTQCVEQSAMKRAAQPAVFKTPEGEVGAAVRAMPVDQ